MLRVIRAVFRFIYRYGFWPHAHELATLLRADLTGVQYYLRDLEEKGLLMHLSIDHRRRCWQLTNAGWEVVGVQPIDPWNPHPRKKIARIAAKITVDLADIERAARLAAEKEMQ